MLCSIVGLIALAGPPQGPDIGQVMLDVTPHWQHVERGRAVQVAMPMPVDIDVAAAAEREASPAGEIWRLSLSSPRAVFMSAKFSRFILPEGVTVRFVAREEVYEAWFSREDQSATGRFGSPMIPGDELTIEVVVPDGAEAPELIIESVSHGFRDVMGMGRYTGKLESLPMARGAPDVQPAGDPFDCQRDIVCPEGEPYLHLKEAAAEGYDGAFVCSGQLVNNARQDGRSLYLTAAHCEWWVDPSTIVFYWDYANQTCGGDDYPAFTFSTGSVDLYHSTNPNFDVNLLELSGDLEAEFDVYFAGWNRGEAAPASSVAIHHPADKPLQVAIDVDAAIDCEIGNCPNGFGEAYWRIDDYEVGMTQGGSSGGGLYDQDVLLVGVLTGGVGTNCNNFGWDEYFKLSAEWDELAPFLDPDGTGAESVAGWSGCAADFNGDGSLNILDFVAFQVAFQAMSPAADCNGDGVLNVLDFVCFQGVFEAGCV